MSSYLTADNEVKRRLLGEGGGSETAFAVMSGSRISFPCKFSENWLSSFRDCLWNGFHNL